MYKHYGLQELLPTLTAPLGVPVSLLPVLYSKMYHGFVEEVDQPPAEVICAPPCIFP